MTSKQMKPLDQLKKFLVQSTESNTKLVVGLDGYSGIGKTWISNEVEMTLPNTQVIHMDDYVVTANTKEKLEPQLDNMELLNLEWKDVDGKGFKTLQEEIENFKKNIDSEPSIMLIEGIFLFHPDVLSNCFDKIIFLDGDEKLADERRVKREKERWGDKYFPETHPDSFARLFKLAWNKYKKLYTPKEKADLVVEV